MTKGPRFKCENQNTNDNRRKANKRKTNMNSLAEDVKQATLLGMSYGEYQAYKKENGI